MLPIKGLETSQDNVYGNSLVSGKPPAGGGKLPGKGYIYINLNTFENGIFVSKSSLSSSVFQKFTEMTTRHKVLTIIILIAKYLTDATGSHLNGI